MKILLVTITYGLFNEKDGVVPTLKNLQKEFNKLGITADVLTYGPTNTIQESCPNTVYSHKPLLPVKIDVMPYYVDPLFFLTLTYKNLLERSYDAVVSFSPDFLGLGAIRYGNLHQVPVIGWHATNAYKYAQHRGKFLISDMLGRLVGSLLRKYVYWFLNKTDHVLVHTQEALCDMEEKIRVKKSIIHSGVDLERFSPSIAQKVAKTSPRILSVGRIEPEKNLEILIPYFQKRYFQKKSNVSLTFVGDGSYLSTLKAALPHAKFVGKVSHESIQNYYRSADVFAFPSTTDTFGLAVLEAMACGVPVVVMSGEGPATFVEHRKSGFIAKSTQEFYEYLDLLISDEALRVQLGRGAREAALKYSWASTTNTLFQVIKEAIQLKHTL